MPILPNAARGQDRVNLLLVERDELRPDASVVLADRRADHLRSVIGATVGQTVRAGVVSGRSGTAEVTDDDGARMTLRLRLTAQPSVPIPIELVLAVPRPKVLLRTIQAAAAFGVTRIDLTNAWRVDKSYLGSPKLAPEALGRALRLGAEQGATTYLPPVVTHSRLMSLLNRRWPLPSEGLSREFSEEPNEQVTGRPASTTTRLLAHPDAPPIERASLSWPLTIAVGPEGGWIEREIDTFVDRGFVPVSMGAPILRVESAVSAILGQLLLLHRLRRLESGN